MTSPFSFHKLTLIASAGLMLALSLSATAPSLSAPSNQKVRSQVQEFKNNEVRIKELKNKIQELEKKARNSKENISEIQQELEKTKLELDKTNRRYEVAHKEVEVITKQLLRAEQSWESRLDASQDRLREMYKLRRYSQTNQLVEAQNLSSFMRRLTYFRYLAKQDQNMLDEMRLAKEKLERYQYQQMLKRQILGKKAHEQAQAKALHEYQKRKEQQYLARVQKEKAVYEKEMNALEAESRRIAEYLRQLYAARSGGGSRMSSVPLGSGRFTSPVPGAVMTSPFGWRTHPIFGTARLHTGIDFGVGSGTPIRAADHGVVIDASWMGGYGKAVMVDHGQGLVTLYAHTSAYYVTVGQRVRKGQIIAAVGSTGYSTGPHLHLEVRKNGNPIDPRPFF
jgi:murein DD-endopeptidase MepM/ murein hydrolase activator NlpD